MTDGKGKLIECKNAIFVMTSNLASEEIAHYGLQLREEADLINSNKMEERITAGNHFTLRSSKVQSFLEFSRDFVS